MKDSNTKTNIEKIHLITKDNYRIAATRYIAHSPVKAHLIVAGGAGISQRFYRHFAEYACKRGFTTLTLDYRGIGESKPDTLKGFEASWIGWAQLDLAAAVDEMKDESLPLFMIGHSYGGQALGLLPNHQYIDKFYTFATGSGWSGWMPYLERIRVMIMWHLILPVIVKINGYMAWSKLGMGEDLPVDIYRKWKYWCSFPHYFFDDPAMKETAALYKKVRTPIMAANSFDDRWAPPRSRDAFMFGYCNAPVETRNIDPVNFKQRIGHLGYFKPGLEPLWDDVFEWFTGSDNLFMNSIQEYN